MKNSTSYMLNRYYFPINLPPASKTDILMDYIPNSQGFPAHDPPILFIAIQTSNFALCGTRAEKHKSIWCCPSGFEAQQHHDEFLVRNKVIGFWRILSSLGVEMQARIYNSLCMPLDTLRMHLVQCKKRCLFFGNNHVLDILQAIPFLF